MKKDGKGRTALVTGASAGIGTALARVFARNGFDVVLTARREHRLSEVARDLENDFGVTACVIAADLADPGAPAALASDLERRKIAVDALVNNAGYGVAGRYRNSPWETHATFLRVLVTAVAELTHRFEPGMTSRGYGRIINVASLAALVPGSAGHTLYGASKAFLVKFSESLALEHRKDGVQVSALCPGFTYSEFHDVLGNRKLVSRLPKYMWMDAETVAREGYDAVMAGRVLCVPGVVNQTIASVTRLIPEPLALRLMQAQAARIRVAD